LKKCFPQIVANPPNPLSRGNCILLFKKLRIEMKKFCSNRIYEEQFGKLPLTRG
jgi:hypothetical protein